MESHLQKFFAKRGPAEKNAPCSWCAGLESRAFPAQYSPPHGGLFLLNFPDEEDSAPIVKQLKSNKKNHDIKRIIAITGSQARVSGKIRDMGSIKVSEHNKNLQKFIDENGWQLVNGDHRFVLVLLVHIPETGSENDRNGGPKAFLQERIVGHTKHYGIFLVVQVQ